MSRKWQNILINWAVEFGPMGVFFGMLAFVGNDSKGFVVATGMFTLATILALLTAYIREGRVAIFALVAGAFIVVFGLATVYFDKPWIFQFEATMYHSFLALVLLPGLLRKHGSLKIFFIGLFDLKERGWFLISVHYFILFIVIAITNEFIWRTYPQSVWIIYKYIATISTIALGVCEIPVGKKYRNASATAWGVRTTSKSDKGPFLD